MSEKESKKGCGCAVMFMGGFVLWLVLVLGPFFPSKATPPFSIGFAGSVQNGIFLAKNEMFRLKPYLFDSRSLRWKGEIRWELILPRQQIVSLTKQRLLLARHQGTTTLTLRVGRWSNEKVVDWWTRKVRVWVAPWHKEGDLKGVVSGRIPHHSLHHNFSFSSLHLFTSQKKLHLLYGSCRWPDAGDCKSWQLFRFEKKSGLEPLDFPLPDTFGLSFPSYVSQDKIIFTGRVDRNGKGFKNQMSLYDLRQQSWSYPKLSLRRQYKATISVSRESLFLLGGTSQLSSFGGRLIQSFNLKSFKSSRFGKLPDRAWKNDKAVSVGDKIYLLSQRGAFRVFDRKTRKWKQLQGFPKRFCPEGNCFPVLVSVKRTLFAIWTHPSLAKYELWAYLGMEEGWKVVSYLPHGFLLGASLHFDGRDLWCVGQKAEGDKNIILLRFFWRYLNKLLEKHAEPRTKPSSVPSLKVTVPKKKSSP